MKRHRRLIIPGVAVVVLAAIGITGWRMVFSPQAQARRLAGELCGQGPSTVEGWLIKIRLLRPRDREPDEIVDELAALGRPAVPALREALRQGNEEVRIRVLDIFAEMGPPGGPAVPDVLGQLKDSDSDVRYAAARALGGIGPATPEVVPALIRCLDDADTVVRSAAAEILGEIGPAAEQAIGPLAGAIRSGREGLNDNLTVIALGKLGPKAVDPLIEIMLGDGPSSLFAAMAFEHVGAPAVEPLIRVLRSDHRYRYRAAEALGVIGEPARPAVPLLLEALNADTDDFPRVCAAQALGRIGTADDPGVVPALLRLLGDRTSWPLRSEAAEALADLCPPAKAAREALTAALKDDAPRVRRSAAVALVEIDPGRSANLAVPVLTAYLEAPHKSGKRRGDSRVFRALGILGPAASPAIPALQPFEQGCPAARRALAIIRTGADPGEDPSRVNGQREPEVWYPPERRKLLRPYRPDDGSGE